MIYVIEGPRVMRQLGIGEGGEAGLESQDMVLPTTEGNHYSRIGRLGDGINLLLRIVPSRGERQEDPNCQGIPKQSFPQMEKRLVQILFSTATKHVFVKYYYVLR